jgi:DNA-binding beta-propeller fold protein YncE
VISGQTNTVVGTVTVGSDPVSVAANPKTNSTYVASLASGTVSVLGC